MTSVNNFKAARGSMVKGQMMARGISDRLVLEAFGKVPREKFVPPEFVEQAYEDFPLSIGCAQTISQPYMVALMTQELRAKRGHKVLEVGTGSGYQTAILTELGCVVFSIERYEVLLKTAQATLEALGYRGIQFRHGDGTLGWPEEAPFDRIMVTAGAPRIPGPLFEQLREEGILIIPVGGDFQQTLLSVTKKSGKRVERSLDSCVFVKLFGKEGWQE